MGTTKEWVEVVLAATFWGGLMLLVKVLERKGAWTKSVMPGRQVLIWALGGLVFGLVTTFGWKRAFSFPLIFLTVGLFITAWVAARLLGRESADKSPDNVNPSGSD